MKQITKDIVLKQGDKSYSAIQTEQGIVWIDNTFPSFNDWYYIPFTNAFEQYKKSIKYGEFHPHKMLWNKIIAANFELEGVPKIELEDEVKYDYDALGELRINEAIVAFEKRHGYQLQTKEERDRIYKETNKGGDYLYYLNHSFEDDKLLLNYNEHTPHDCPYWVSLELPIKDLIYPKLKSKANQAQYTEEDIDKVINLARRQTDNGGAYYKKQEILQSLNSIKEITVDENFKQI